MATGGFAAIRCLINPVCYGEQPWTHLEGVSEMQTRFTRWTMIAGLLALFIITALSTTHLMQAQVQRPWFVWEKTTPCQDTRQDWFTVSQTYPGSGSGSVNSWQREDGPFDTFAAAMGAADASKMSKFIRFKNRCCNDWAVFQDVRTKTFSVIRVSAITAVPEGQMLLRGGL